MKFIPEQKRLEKALLVIYTLSMLATVLAVFYEDYETAIRFVTVSLISSSVPRTHYVLQTLEDNSLLGQIRYLVLSFTIISLLIMQVIRTAF